MVDWAQNTNQLTVKLVELILGLRILPITIPKSYQRLLTLSLLYVTLVRTSSLSECLLRSESYVRIISGLDYSLHDMTHSMTEIPEAGVQLPECRVAFGLLHETYVYRCGVLLSHQTLGQLQGSSWGNYPKRMYR